jgi:hypothetical protein
MAEISAFELPVYPNQKFGYWVGSVFTEKPWVAPTIPRIMELIKDAIKLENYGKYDIFLIGGVVNGGIGNTMDIDMAINGQLDYVEFEQFLHNFYDLALNKHRLLIDVKWLNQKPMDNVDIEVKYKAVQFGKVSKQVGEVISTIDMFKNNKMLTEHLVEREINFPSTKALKNRTTNFIQI